MERAAGVEPASSGWRPVALPLSYARLSSSAQFCYEIRMDDEDLTEQIARLEARIEELAEMRERCRKLMLASRLAIIAGLVLVVVMLLGVVGFNATAMLAGITAVVGGIVVFGSNSSTADQAAAALRDAEAERARLIGMIDLKVVGETIH